MKETDLFPPLKKYLETTGYAVRVDVQRYKSTLSFRTLFSGQTPFPEKDHVMFTAPDFRNLVNYRNCELQTQCMKVLRRRKSGLNAFVNMTSLSFMNRLVKQTILTKAFSLLLLRSKEV